MYLYIALILSLATATGFALLAAKRGRDYNRLWVRYKDAKETIKITSEKLQDRYKYIMSLEAEIKAMQAENNRLKQSGIKAGIILQSCGSVDCDGKPGYCAKCSGKAGNLFGQRNVCK